jgi:hypothetical protein
VRVSRLKPLIVVTYFTPWTDFRRPSIFRVTSSVRWKDAASGSWTFKRRKPWSSSGMNPEGRRRPRPAAKTAKPARMSRLTAVFRMRRCERST